MYKETGNPQECLNEIFSVLMNENGSGFDWCNNITFNAVMTERLIDRYIKKTNLINMLIYKLKSHKKSK